MPTGVLPRAGTLDEFDRLLAALVALVHDADGLPLHAVRITSPPAVLRYDAYSCLEMLPSHQIRHLRQAEAVWPNAAPAP